MLPCFSLLIFTHFGGQRKKERKNIYVYHAHVPGTWDGRVFFIDGHIKRRAEGVLRIIEMDTRYIGGEGVGVLLVFTGFVKERRNIITEVHTIVEEYARRVRGGNY